MRYKMHPENKVLKIKKEEKKLDMFLGCPKIHHSLMQEVHVLSTLWKY